MLDGWLNSDNLALVNRHSAPANYLTANKMNNNNIGSCFSSSFKLKFILEGVLDELQWAQIKYGNFLSLPENSVIKNELNNLVGEIQDFDVDYEDSHDLIDKAFNFFSNHCAKPYCYFGAHTGNTSDFGFWPDMEQINDLPFTSGDGDYKEVNDHGNITIFSFDGKVILEIV